MRSIKSAFRVSVILFLLVIVFFSCATFPELDSAQGKIVSFGQVEAIAPHWLPLAAHEGADALACFAGKIASPKLEFHALRLDLFAPSLRVVVKGGAVGSGGVSGEGAFSTKVSSFVRDNGLLAGINALPFAPVSSAEGEPRINVGIVVSDGVMLSPPHSGYDALVFYADGGAAVVPQLALESAAGIANAVGGFHQVLKGGEVAARALGATARHPRSAAGVSADGRFLYLLAIDGRRLGSIGSTEGETALALKALGAHDGINFDGGGSTALALLLPSGKVRAVNVPIHGGIAGRERAVAGCVGIGINQAVNESVKNLESIKGSKNETE